MTKHSSKAAHFPKSSRVAKPVAQYDLDGNLIATYPSINAAARATNCGTIGNLSVVFDRPSRTHMKCYWRSFDGKAAKKIAVGPPRKFTNGSGRAELAKAVASYDTDGKLVQVFASRVKAGQEHGVVSSRISQAIVRPSRTVSGLYWRDAKGGAPPTIEIPIADYYVTLAAKRKIAEDKRLAEQALAAKVSAVVEVDVGGNVLQEFRNASAAARYFGVTRSLVGQALADPPIVKTVVGRRVRYAHPELRRKG